MMIMRNLSAHPSPRLTSPGQMSGLRSSLPCLRVRWLFGLWLLFACLLPAGETDAAPKKSTAPRPGGPPLKITASSSARDAGKLLGPELALDGDLATVWQAASPSSGEGEWLEIEFRTPRPLASLTIFGGDFSSRTAFVAHNHVAEAVLELTTKTGQETIPLTFADRYEPLSLHIGREVRKLRLTLKRLYAGAIYANGCIAELAFDLELKDPSVLSALDGWKHSQVGESQLTQWRSRLQEARTALKRGNLEAFPPVLDAARRGLDPIRAFLSTRLAPGFVLSHLDPEPLAIEIIQDLGLPDAVPAVEQAVWLVDDVDASRMRELASFLMASGDLNRPPRRNLPRFGTTGWELGAFQSLNGPLPFASDNAGYLYVADVGNNRVQRLDPDGKFERSSGSTPQISQTFLDLEMPHYVAGHRPGEGRGQFVQPVAIASNGKDKLVVLDAHARLQVLDVDLHSLLQWNLPDDAGVSLSPGEVYPRLLWHERRIYCLWGSRVFVFDEGGRLTRRFTLQQPARAAVAFKRMLLVYHGGRTLHHYGLDGVYLGELLNLPDKDPVEDLELAVGPDKRLYVHSDQSQLYRYSFKGELLATGKSGMPVGLPVRLVVTPEVVLMSANDRLKRLALSTLTAP